MTPAPHEWLAAVAAGLRRRVHRRSRARRHRLFMAVARPTPGDTVLDVGATDHQGYGANLLEELYPWPAQITAAAVEPLRAFPAAFPEVSTVRVDGRTLPFPDAAFDIVYSNAVLEHVGDARAQLVFLTELARVCRRLVFVATPDRAFPVDSHTLVPFAHWFSPSVRDGIYARLGVGEWVRGKMRLVSAGQLLGLAGAAGWTRPQLVRQRLFGLPSVLIVWSRLNRLD